MSRAKTSRAVKAVAVSTAAGVVTILGAASAAAHVTVNPPTALAGSETQLTFRAANEAAAARFTRLVIHLPAAQPLASLATRPLAGWDVRLTKAKLAKPITTDDGTATEYTSTITWTATAGGIPPDAYQNFDVSVGPLPDQGAMTFTADQTYSDGTVVHWNEPAKAGAAEPDHPAPVLTLTRATDDSGDASSGKGTSDGVARGLAISGIVVGAAGLTAAGLAYRRRGNRD